MTAGWEHTNWRRSALKKEQSKKYRTLQTARIAAQAVFFLLFLRLLIGAHYTGKDYIGGASHFFFHTDPLLALATSVAARAAAPFIGLALVTAVLTLVFGRFFCGWFCPLGAVHQFFSFAFKRAKFLKPPKEDRSSLVWKYLILVVVLAGVVFGLDLAGYLDPISFLTRSFAAAILPGLAYVLSCIGGLSYGLGWSGLGRATSALVENWTLNTIFVQSLVIGLVFLAAVLLNSRRERFWCRYLCPTGALLGLLSRLNVLKLRIDEEACIKCGLCSRQCPTLARPFPNDKWRSGECVYCFTCASVCPTGAIRFRASLKPEKLGNVSDVSIGRRRLLTTALVGAASVPLFRLTPLRKRASEKLIRPAGALAEDKFLAKCVKCGQCMRACPTNGLQPALNEAGPEGIWTPVLVPRIGYCEYYCSLCGQVCPTGAIRNLPIEEKNKIKMGTAWVDKTRCIPHVLGRPCIVCEEHCPVSPKAIRLVDVQTRRPDGTTVVQKAPFIDVEACIGCGICENKCPVVDKPAIRVTSIGETRSARNKLLLEVSGGEDTPNK